MSDTINVGLIQQRCSNSRTENITKSIGGIRKAVKEGANLIVLQELHCSEYFCQAQELNSFDLSESIPGPSTEQLGVLAKELECVIVASLFERRGPGLFHKAAVILDSNGKIAGRYRQMHCVDRLGFHESFYFTPGDYTHSAYGFEPIETSLGKLGILASCDQWFPEAARLMALAGAELLICPTSLGWNANDEKERQRQLDAWLILLRGHAIANGLPLIAVNRVGEEVLTNNGSSLEFWGSSVALDPQGEILYRASTDGEIAAVVPIEMSRARQVSRDWPFLRGRRVDAYQELLSRYLDRH